MRCENKDIIMITDITGRALQFAAKLFNTIFLRCKEIKYKIKIDDLMN